MNYNKTTLSYLDLVLPSGLAPSAEAVSVWLNAHLSVTGYENLFCRIFDSFILRSSFNSVYKVAYAPKSECLINILAQHLPKRVYSSSAHAELSDLRMSSCKMLCCQPSSILLSPLFRSKSKRVSCLSVPRTTDITTMSIEIIRPNKYYYTVAHCMGKFPSYREDNVYRDSKYYFCLLSLEQHSFC